MEPPQERVRTEKEGKLEVLVRMCDSFTRTVNGTIIRPTIKAEESLRVAFKLQQDTISNIVKRGGKKFGLEFLDIQWHTLGSNKIYEGNIFIRYAASEHLSNEKFDQYKKHLTSEIQKTAPKVKGILIHQVQDRKTIPQPIISETDFEMHKLDLTIERLLRAENAMPDRTAFAITVDNIKAQLEDVKEKYTKIAVLSQNGKGKSFILNLLFLLTADTEEEYRKNNETMKLPKDIAGNPTVGNIETDENLYNLPNVVKDFLRKSNDNDDFKTLLEPICHVLSHTNHEEVTRTENSFSEIKRYFMEKKIIAMEPYILPQKTLEGTYESTTKCIIHLRYGTVYQMRVEYFTTEELQQQLFVLASPINEELPLDALLERYKVLANNTESEDDDEKILQKAQQTFHCSEDITLCEEVQKFAGTTELYIGRGKNITEDCLALQTHLRKLTTVQDSSEDEKRQQRKKVAAVKKIVVYLPSRILEGGKEILEMPGTDESDPLAIHFIQDALNEADATLLLSDFSFNTAEKEVKDIIVNSHFIKYWHKDQEKFKLMLLSYPEKVDTWKFGINDHNVLKRVETEAKKKRKEELKRINKMLKDKYPEPLSNAIEDSIYTSYILPVLHTSIHAQEGMPHEILENYSDFLKSAGINDLIITLDEFVARKYKAVTMEVRNHLQNLEDTTKTLTAAEAGKIVNLYSKRGIKNVYDPQLMDSTENNLIQLKKTLEKIINEIIDNEVRPLLSNTTQKAKERWDKTEKKVTTMAVFNPFYRGRNALFPVQLYDVMFTDLNEMKSKIFNSLLMKIKGALDDYKDKTIDLFTMNLTNLLGDSNNYVKQFVETAVKQSLEDALSWYIGKKRMPFDERTLEKYFDKSLKDSLKENLLVPAFSCCTIEIAKEKVTQSIEKTIKGIPDKFKKYLFIPIHVNRWKSLYSRLKSKEKPRMWVLLIGKLLSFSRNREIDLQKDKLGNVIRMVSERLYSDSN